MTDKQKSAIVEFTPEEKLDKLLDVSSDMKSAINSINSKIDKTERIARYARKTAEKSRDEVNQVRKDEEKIKKRITILEGRMSKQKRIIICLVILIVILIPFLVFLLSTLIFQYK